MIIETIRTGGQTGTDRGATDAARAHNVKTTGWVPRGGWAEDFLAAPGLLKDYPKFQETESKGTRERTIKNIQDADISVVFDVWDAPSPGVRVAEHYLDENPGYIRTYVDTLDERRIIDLCDDLYAVGKNRLDVNIIGPRESECPGAYKETYDFISTLLDYLSDDND